MVNGKWVRGKGQGTARAISRRDFLQKISSAERDVWLKLQNSFPCFSTQLLIVHCWA